jgi:hypothetical protein
MVYQEVHINRKEANSIEFANNEIFIPVKPGEEHTFEISIINHGTPTHVHFSTSTNLRDKIVFLRDNPYVQREVKIPAVVHLPASSEKLYQGEIYVSTGYGSKKKSFIAKLGIEVEEEKIPVIVDESLSRYERPIEKPKAISFKLPTLFAMPKANLTLTLILIFLGIAIALIALSFWGAIDRFYGSIAASAIIVYLLIYVVGKIK